MLIKWQRRIRSQMQRLKTMLKDCKQRNDLRLWTRVKGIILYLKEKPPNEVASILDVQQSSVYYWIDRYDRFGIDGLIEKEREGRPPRLTQEQLEHLADIVDSGPVAYGFEAGIWTSKMITEVIGQEFGVKYHDAHVRKILYKLGFSVQDPRKKLALADKKLQQKWIRETYPTLKKTSSGKRSSYV